MSFHLHRDFFNAAFGDINGITACVSGHTFSLFTLRRLSLGANFANRPRNPVVPDRRDALILRGR